MNCKHDLEKTRIGVKQKRTNKPKKEAKYCITIGDIFYRFDLNNNVRLVERKCKCCGEVVTVTKGYDLYNYCIKCRSKSALIRKKELFKSIKIQNLIYKKAIRNCLMCGKKFESKNFGNRRCNDCNNFVENDRHNFITYKHI